MTKNLPRSLFGGAVAPGSDGLDLRFSYAFQPSVNVLTQEVHSYEALIRGACGEPSTWVLAQVRDKFRHRFDQRSRVEAITLAAELGLHCHLNLNFLPQSLFTVDDAITTTLEAAERCAIPIEHVVLEVTEGEVIADYALMGEHLNRYRHQGLKVAIDDFGAGYSGLNMLVEFQPDQVKIDMNLLRGIDGHGPRQSVVRAIAQVCRDLRIDVIAEGVESLGEYHWLLDEGIWLYQGYLFAKPAFEAFPAVHFPELIRIREPPLHRPCEGWRCVRCGTDAFNSPFHTARKD